MSRVIRSAGLSDRVGWEGLFTAYALGGGRPLEPSRLDTVWGWIQDPQHEVQALLAVDGEHGAVGLAHYRPFARPITASTGCFLDDLYVADQARGCGVVDELLTALRGVCSSHGWDVVRWTTAENNYRARATYDRLAVMTRRATYDLNVE